MPDKPLKPYRPIENVIVLFALVIVTLPVAVWTGQAAFMAALIMGGADPSSIQTLATTMDHGETTRTLVIGAALGAGFGLITQRGKGGLEEANAPVADAQDDAAFIPAARTPLPLIDPIKPPTE